MDKNVSIIHIKPNNIMKKIQNWLLGVKIGLKWKWSLNHSFNRHLPHLIKKLKTKMRDEKVPDKKLTEVRDGGGGTKRVLTKYLWQIQGLPSLLLVICIVCQNNQCYWKHLHKDKIFPAFNWQGRSLNTPLYSSFRKVSK